MPKFDKSTTEIVIECAKLLQNLGKKTFTRQDIITLFKWKYPDANKDTINPTIQGLTDNAEGGSPNSLRQGYVFHRVDNGIYELME